MSSIVDFNSAPVARRHIRVLERAERMMIRRLYDEGSNELALAMAFQVSPQTIQRVINRQSVLRDQRY